MFDYKAFADEMYKQSLELIPPEFSDKEKEYILTTIGNFAELAGESLNNDKENDFSDEQKVFMTQVIAEWTFHKSVDLIRAEIPNIYWNAILQKIAYAIFEIIKQALLKDIPQEQVLEAVEHHVKKVYKECIKKLPVSDGQKCIASEQSNIDKKAFEVEQNSRKPNKKEAFICGIVMFLILLTLTMLFNSLSISNRMLASIGIPFSALVLMMPLTYWQVHKIEYENITKIILVMLSGFFVSIVTFLLIIAHWKNILKYLDPIFIILIVICVISAIIFKIIINKDVNRQLKELENVRQQMNDLVNPDRMYECLGVDVINLQVGQNLLCIADPDQDGLLLAKIAAIRQRLTYKYGYIIPNIRIQDSTELKENEYLISIRNNIVNTGFVYPNKYMVILDQWNKTGKPIPEGAIRGVDPTYKTGVIWISENDTRKTKEVTAVAPDDVIIQHLQEVLIQQVDKVLSEKDIRKCIDLVKEDNSVSIDSLLSKLSYGDIRQVYVNLIREKVSVRDITLLLSRLDNYSRYHKEPDILSERIRKDFSRQISLTHCNDDKKIYAIDLSQEITTKLLECVELQKEFNKTKLSLDKQYEHDFMENVAMKLMETHKKIDTKPVILCNEKLRLALYRLLVKHIPTVVVLANVEIEQDIKLEIVDTIK